MAFARFMLGLALSSFKNSLLNKPAPTTWVPPKAWASKILCGALALVLLTQALIFGVIWLIGYFVPSLTWQDGMGIIFILLSLLSLLSYSLYEYYGREQIMPDSSHPIEAITKAFQRGWAGR